jgi:hypothetical protein
MAAWLPTNNETLHIAKKKDAESATMDQATTTVQKINEEFVNFQKTMEELCMLKRVASDLKSYRRMIKLKKYD